MNANVTFIGFLQYFDMIAKIIIKSFYIKYFKLR